MSIQSTSRSTWSPSWDCSSENQKACHNSVDAKKSKMNNVLLVGLQTLWQVVSISTDYSSLSLLVSCRGKWLSFLIRKAVGGRPQLGSRIPAHTVRCSLLQQREKVPATESRRSLLGLQGPFFQWNMWQQATSEKRKPGGNLRQTWRTSRWLGYQKDDHPWDPEGLI